MNRWASIFLVLLTAVVCNGCAAAALVGAIAYASSSADEADAEMIRARAEWESMNVEREKAGLAPLPYPGDDKLEEMSDEDKARGREAWERMNERRKQEGKDPIPMPKAYEVPEQSDK